MLFGPRGLTLYIISLIAIGSVIRQLYGKSEKDLTIQEALCKCFSSTPEVRLRKAKRFCIGTFLLIVLLICGELKHAL